MIKTSILLAAFTLSLAAAIPFGEEVDSLARRQSNAKGTGAGLTALLGGLGGSGGFLKMLGEPSAMETLTSLIKVMGGSKTSPGSFPKTLEMMNQGYGTVAAPEGAVQVETVLKSPFDIPGAQRVKIRYGPYKVPNMNKKNMIGAAGMLYNWPHRNIQKPCEGNCTLLGMSPGLEFVDGSNANIDQGLWLHHLILYNQGPGREDLTCNHRDISVPHASIGGTPRNTERIFASGNERAKIVFPDSGVKDAGIKLRSTDQFGAILEFMNENTEDKVIYLTMTYDFVPGHPFKDDVRALWFDVRQCGTSEVNPPKGKSQFSVDYTWKASFDGTVINTAGHLHDGGKRTLLTVDDKPVCESTASYGGTPDYISKNMGAHSHGGPSIHLSDMKVCAGNNLPNAEMKKGSVWRLRAEYDFDQNKGDTHGDGSLDSVMGIQLVYVRTK